MDHNDKLANTMAIINNADWCPPDAYTAIHAAGQAQLRKSAGCICRSMPDGRLQA
jgi:hypothetical protein